MKGIRTKEIIFKIYLKAHFSKGKSRSSFFNTIENINSKFE